METSLVKSGGAEKSKKNRSFEIQSKNKNEVSKNRKRNGGVEENGDLVNRHKNKKSIKRELLCSFGVAGKRSRSKLEKSHGDGSGLNRSRKLEGKFGIFLSLERSGRGIEIPKRPRGFVGSKKCENNLVSSPPIVEISDSEDDNIVKINRDVKGKFVSVKGKGKLGVDDNKKNSSSSKTTALVSEAEKDVNNNSNVLSFRKRSAKNRKRKRSELISDKFEHADNNLLKTLVDTQDEDEENLEQNAARMLSSRFNPSCTQFSPSTDNLSSLMALNEDFVSREINMSTVTELESGDLDNRVLRPRKKQKEDGISRNRRQYYEIFARDMDSYWAVNKRIKVFWPLDQSWYYGLVSGYNSETKLHHIKYDDRDEEWIDLQNEKFKLLLLSNEVPHKPEPERDALENKNNDGDENENDLLSDDSLEPEPEKDALGNENNDGDENNDEPIISWLIRSSPRVKSSHIGSPKRHKTSHLSPKSSEKLSKKAINSKECLEKSDNSKNKIDNLAELERSSDPSRTEKSRLEDSNTISRDEISPVVYVRRRFRKKNNGSIDTDNMACGSTPVSTIANVPVIFDGSRENDISLELVESESLSCSVDNVGLLKLTIPLLENRKLSLELGFQVYNLNTFEAEDSWVIRAMLLLKYGVVMNMWPKVNLEILFVDNFSGLRFLLFEGSLKQVMEFVVLVMSVFHRPNRKADPVCMPTMPATSIKFKISCLEDSRKQHIFAVYSFLEIKSSKWSFLISKLQQHCLFSKQLPLSDCTYDNIKASESGNQQLPANEGLWRKSLHVIIPEGYMIDSHFGDMDWSPLKDNNNKNHGMLLPFAISFSAAASFFLSLHLKYLMENIVASTTLHEKESNYTLEHSEKSCPSIQNYSTNMENSLPSNSGISSKPTLGLETASKCSDHVQLLNNNRNKKNDADTSVSSEASDKNSGDTNMQLSETEHVGPETKQIVSSSFFPVSKDKNHGLSVELPIMQSDERPVINTSPPTISSSAMGSNISDNIVCEPKTNGPRLIWRSGGNSGNPEFIGNGFNNGPKKPRTQVKYTLPPGGLDSSPNNNSHNIRGLHFHRIRKANDKSGSEVTGNFKRNKGFLACDANVLITIGEKGWREFGARVELESADHNEWKIAVKFSGITKFSYKAYQFLQPGSTNRYTHAMMWKGGKDWVLEFPDRNQWMLFKEMHEECFNRNLRAASVKNIPIPGVRLIEECVTNGTDFPFLRNSEEYFRQVENDFEMAMDPSRILYDMDSEDEMWISDQEKSSEFEEFTMESFERTMDILEKMAFVKKSCDFNIDEIEEFMGEIGTMKSIRSIHEHWQRKRLKKGMPLIRHLQPPLWESYQQQVKEWEKAVGRANSAASSGSHERAPPLEKPPMFAFCLKPRGLEIPNKGTKQRSHRRYPLSGNNYSLLGDHDAVYASGRKSNGYGYYGDEKVMYLGNTYDYSDTSPSYKVFSPRDAGGFGQLSLGNDSSEWNIQHPKYHRNNSKNVGYLRSPNNIKPLAPFNQRTSGKRNGVNRFNNNSLPQWPNQRHNISDHSDVSFRYGREQLDGPDLDEFRLRDASSAAQHAHNMARLKREKAQRLLYRADLATHKAMAALMTAKAIKSSCEDLSDENNENDDDSGDDESTEDDYSSDDESEADDSDDSDRTR